LLLAALHAGTIRAESEGPGRGSRFVLELPACDPPGARAQDGQRLEEPVAAAALRVLIVDDSRDAAESLAMLVRLSGHEAHTVHDGAGALDAGEHLRPHVVFLDIGMPVLDGYATARQLRQRGWGQAVKLYALTGYGQEQDRQRTRDAGFDRHFVKPIDPGIVEQLLADLSCAGPTLSSRIRPS
jgi:CheY-like chemotaxis protein